MPLLIFDNNYTAIVIFSMTQTLAYLFINTIGFNNVSPARTDLVKTKTKNRYTDIKTLIIFS